MHYKEKTMPTYEFECNKCGEVKEIRCNYKDIKRMSCKCGGKLVKVFTPTVSIIGVNPYIDKPGMDAAQSRRRAAESLEKRKHMRLNKGGIL